MSLSDSFAQGEVIRVTGGVPKLVNYADATYKYVCLARAGTSLSDSKWAVFRTEIATGNITHASGFSNWSDVATDLATVAALTYS